MELAGLQRGSNNISLGVNTKTTCTTDTHPVCHARCQIRKLKPQDLEQAIVLEEQGEYQVQSPTPHTDIPSITTI